MFKRNSKKIIPMVFLAIVCSPVFAQAPDIVSKDLSMEQTTGTATPNMNNQFRSRCVGADQRNKKCVSNRRSRRTSDESAKWQGNEPRVNVARQFASKERFEKKFSKRRNDSASGTNDKKDCTFHSFDHKGSLQKSSTHQSAAKTCE